MKKLHKEFMEVVNSLIKKKLKHEPIQAIILGGSVARNDEIEHSDIDIVFYVKKKDMPNDFRSFYKFKGKYIEEHYSPIEELKNENILPEEKILYDKTKRINKLKFNEARAKKIFSKKFNEAKRYQKLAEDSFRKKNYEKSFYYLYGLGNPARIIMQALPPRFNLPFPSFRLLKSVKTIDKKHKTKTYEKIKKIYTFKNKNQKKILKNFAKGYKLMNRIKKAENPKSKNLGFFDKTKIKYNLAGLRKTFEDYPFVFAYRFIIGCLTMWAGDKNIKIENRKKLQRYLFSLLGIKKFNRNLVKQKLKLSNELIKEGEKLKIK